MKVQSFLVVSLVLVTAVSAQAQRMGGRGEGEKNLRERLNKEDPKERNARIAKEKELRKANLTEDATYRLQSELSQASGGKADSLRLQKSFEVSYKVEVPDVGGKSTHAIELNVGKLAEQLVQNLGSLKRISSRDLSPEQQGLQQAKMDLAQEATLLMTLASNKYAGSDGDLVLARDAYARQLETAVKMTAPDSIANATEVAQHRAVISAITLVKDQNPTLSEAEATLIGVKKAYKDEFVNRCRDGSCQVPSDKTLEAGAKTRLKELKDCV